MEANQLHNIKVWEMEIIIKKLLLRAFKTRRIFIQNISIAGIIDACNHYQINVKDLLNDYQR